MFQTILGVYRDVIDWFWSPAIWLPANTTWNDVKPNDFVKYTDYRDLYIPIPMAMLILVVRFVVERKLFSRFGIYLGIKPPRYRPLQPNPILEIAYSKYKYKKKLRYHQIASLSKQTDWSEIKIQRWLRIRHSRSKVPTLSKFCESMWKFLYYLFAFPYGIFCLWDKPWFWDTKQCWYSYPHHSVADGVWWWYMFELTFYWSLTITQFTDAKRKDFWEMFIHHITTVCLLCFSWTCNLTRMGTLVLLSAKMAKYANHETLCSALFTVFTALWIVSRLGLYPFWILRSTAVEAPAIIPLFPVYYIFNSLLLILLLLHTIWTYFILKIAVKSIVAGCVQKDERSSSDSVDSSDQEKTDEQNCVAQPKQRNCLVNQNSNMKLNISEVPRTNGPNYVTSETD